MNILKSGKRNQINRTSFKIARALTHSSDKFCRRDWSFLVSVARIAFSPYNSPAYCIHNKNMRNPTLISLLSSKYFTKIVHNHVTCILCTSQYLCQVFCPSKRIQTPCAASSLAFYTYFSFICTSLIMSLTMLQSVC